MSKRTAPGAYAAQRVAQLIGRLRPADTERFAERMLATIDDVSAGRWEAAQARAANLPGGIRPEKVDALTRSMSRELAVTGAAAGAAAMKPGIGVASAMFTFSTELFWFTGRAGDLVLTIAALHGREAPTVEERRSWVLAVLIYGSSAKDGFRHAVEEVSGKTPIDQVPLATIQLANRVMGHRFVRRYGTRRGILALGRALPMGIGAAVGGAGNYQAIRRLARDADRFFATMPYSAIDVDSVDLTDRRI